MQRDGIEFHYLDIGEGLPFVFQHGLTGDVTQPLDLFGALDGARLIALDCRAHGQTPIPADAGSLNFSTFADDVIALLDHLNLESVVIGGISMGAGVSLNLTLRYPERVRGLILVRPAWLDEPLPRGLEAHVYAAQLMREHDGAEALHHFTTSDVYARLRDESADTAESILGNFEQPELAIRLERIPQDAPNHDQSEWGNISVPALVIGCENDFVHPFSYALTLAEAIPYATLQAVTAKLVDEARYTTETRGRIHNFLRPFLD